MASLEAYRTTWLVTMQVNPGEGIKILRSKAPGVYTWLYRNDKAWLLAHVPLRNKQKMQPGRVNWEKRDLQLAEEVKLAAFLLKNLPERPIRVTISAIGREVGQLALIQKHLDKLPLTANTLHEYVEAHEEFAVRRVQWATENYRREHIYPQRWQLVKHAGVERLAGKPQVKEAIDAAWRSLNSSMSHNIDFFLSNEPSRVGKQ